MRVEKEKIKAGACILEEKPFVYVLKSNFRKEKCDYCLKDGKLLKCSRCSYVHYCNVECQGLAWRDHHRHECSSLKGIFPRSVPDCARMMLKIIQKLENGGHHAQGFYSKTKFRKFRDLMPHREEIAKDERRIEHFSVVVQVLQKLVEHSVLPNSTELLGIYGRLIINSFNILDDDMNSIGTGMYLGASIVDHSCRPNAVATFHGTTLNIRAMHDMTVDWSKIFISYIDLLNTTADRQKNLQQSYYFLCECVKCTEPISNIGKDYLPASCPSGSCVESLDFMADPDTKACPKCATVITKEHINTYNEVMSFTNIQLSSMSEMAYLDVCQLCLEKHKFCLHKLNMLHVKILDNAFESANVCNKWKEACKFGEELIPGLKKYHGELNPLVGLLYMKVGKINLHLENLELAMKYLTEAAKILRITHGEDHNLYKNKLMEMLIQLSL